MNTSPHTSHLSLIYNCVVPAHPSSHLRKSQTLFLSPWLIAVPWVMCCYYAIWVGFLSLFLTVVKSWGISSQLLTIWMYTPLDVSSSLWDGWLIWLVPGSNWEDACTVFIFCIPISSLQRVRLTPPYISFSSKDQPVHPSRFPGRYLCSFYFLMLIF